MDASTLEEWWEKTHAMVLAALETDRNHTDTARMRMELEMYEAVQIYTEILDIEEARIKNKDQAITISDDE
eukprot:7012496-Heterocapsa_arctica.AAC.1